VRTIALEFHDELSALTHGELAKLLEQRGFRVTLSWNGKASNGMLLARR
jgi:hypothetical protein